MVKAFEQWTLREEEFGKKLFFRTGQLTLSRGLTRNLRQSKAVLDRLGLENEIIDRDELLRRFPQFNLEGVELGFYVPSTGIVKCRESCLAVAEALKNKGGQLTLAKADPGRRAGGRLQEVTLSTERTIAAQSFVFACGPWHPKMFPEILGDKLRLNRRVLFFMGTPPDDHRLTFPNCPTFETTSGVYGFPDFEGKGLKLAPYWDSGPLDPDTDERTATAEEITNIHQLTESVFSCPARSAAPRDARQPPNQQHRRTLHRRSPSRAGECLAGRWRIRSRVQARAGAGRLHRKPRRRARDGPGAGRDIQAQGRGVLMR